MTISHIRDKRYWEHNLFLLDDITRYYVHFVLLEVNMILKPKRDKRTAKSVKVQAVLEDDTLNNKPIHFGVYK